VLTLLVGLAVAILLLGAGMKAAREDASRRDAAAAPAATTPTAVATTAAPTPPAEVSKPPEQTRATYAGRVNGAAATVAIAVRDGTAIAYVCDGRQAEAWLRGVASAGRLALTGPDGAALAGSYGSGRAAGSVVATGKQWTFDVPAVAPPSGLYRAAATVANAQVVGGWIVLPDGTQVGVLDTDGTSGPAPRIDPATGGTAVNGTPITATPINGTTGSGF
jgi:hypothetical protein